MCRQAVPPGAAFVVPGTAPTHGPALPHAGSAVMDEDAERIDKWLTIWSEATVAGQTDAAVEAAEELDYLLRRPVVLT